MMKGTTFVWAGLAVVAAGALFLLKFEVQAQEQRLNSLRKEIVATRENIHVLKAEWSYLNDPQRLREQAERHLGMRLLTPDQIGDIAALPPAQPKDRMLADMNDAPTTPAPARTATAPARAAPATAPAATPARATPAPAPARVTAATTAALPPTPQPQPKAAASKTAQPAPAPSHATTQIAAPVLPRETPRTAAPAEAHPSQPRPLAPSAPPSVPVSYPAASAPSANGNVTVILSPALMQERRQ